VINADNGPDNSGVRSQWLKRLIQFSASREVFIQLAYYPPYHSKYNPIERVFGVLENYWNGDPLRTIGKALGMAESMTYNGIHPSVCFIEKPYEKGVKLNAQQRSLCEKALCRLQGLRKWFISINPFSAGEICPLLE
jgi:hypothetical protein